MAFTQPALPFDSGSLSASGMSSQTFDFHYGKHHAAYVTNLNNLVKDTDMENLSLEEVIRKSYGDPSKAGIFNNAAQVWNHTFFWNSLKSNGGGTPTGELAAKIDAAFGSFDKFKEEFTAAATTQFGSGWAWLVAEGGTLRVTKTPNAENPLVHGQNPLLTLDVWEHAYYLDFQNQRPAFIKNFLDNLANWDFAAANLSKTY
jgi:superoxide dismutase, Fe-Mn family